MRILCVFLLFISISVNSLAYAVQKGGVQYTLPIDYSLINEKELSNEADNLFKQYSTAEEQNKPILNKLLSDYSILVNIDNSNTLYITRLGIIFDKLGKDRYAKSNFNRSINLNSSDGYAYSSFGNYYYERKSYRKALKVFIKAYNNGYNKDYNTVYKIGSIYEKFGDYSNALKYYKQAQDIKYTEDLENRVQELNKLLESNNTYNNSLKIRTKK